jgi:hypothetical protein
LKTSSGVASKSAQQPLTKQAERPDQGRLPIDNEAGAELQLNGIGTAARQSLRLALGLDHGGRDDRLSGLVAGFLVGDAYLFCLCVLTCLRPPIQLTPSKTRSAKVDERTKS